MRFGDGEVEVLARFGDLIEVKWSQEGAILPVSATSGQRPQTTDLIRTHAPEEPRSRPRLRPGAVSVVDLRGSTYMIKVG
jgi:hypothetical protein